MFPFDRVICSVNHEANGCCLKEQNVPFKNELIVSLKNNTSWTFSLYTESFSNTGQYGLSYRGILFNMWSKIHHCKRCCIPFQNVSYRGIVFHMWSKIHHCKRFRTSHVVGHYSTCGIRSTIAKDFASLFDSYREILIHLWNKIT